MVHPYAVCFSCGCPNYRGLPPPACAESDVPLGVLLLLLNILHLLFWGLDSFCTCSNTLLELTSSHMHDHDALLAAARSAIPRLEFAHMEVVQLPTPDCLQPAVCPNA